MIKKILRALVINASCSLTILAILVSIAFMFPAVAQEVTTVASRIAFRAATSTIAVPGTVAFVRASDNTNIIKIGQGSATPLMTFKAVSGVVIAPTVALPSNYGCIRINVDTTEYCIALTKTS